VLTPWLYDSYSTTLVGPDGQTVATNGASTNVLAVPGLSLWLVSPWQILGANYGARLQLWGTSPSRDFPRLGGTSSTYGFGDMYLKPFELGWHTRALDVITGFALWIPTGRYSPGASDNTGQGQWGYELSAGATLDAIADDDSGDGTVPVWSGTLADEQFQLDGDEHIRTFRNAKLIATLGELLGVPRAQLRATAPALAPLSVSLPRHVFSSGEIVRASVRSHAAALPEVALVIRPLDESGRPSGAAVSTVSLGALTANAAVRVQVALPASPGLYSITPRSGAPGLEGEPKQFAVQR